MKQEIQEALDATHEKLDALGQTITTEADEIKAEIERLSSNAGSMDAAEIVTALQGIGAHADSMKASVADLVTPSSTDPGPVPGEDTGDGTVPEQ